MTDGARSAKGWAAVAAGSLILVALVGHPVADSAVVSSCPRSRTHGACRSRPPFVAGRPGRHVRRGRHPRSSGRLPPLLLLALANAITTTILGLEPALWTTTPDTSSAWVFLLGVILFGTAAAIAGALARGSAVAFAASIPVGLALDAVAERMAASGSGQRDSARNVPIRSRFLRGTGDLRFLAHAVGSGGKAATPAVGVDGGRQVPLTLADRPPGWTEPPRPLS